MQIIKTILLPFFLLIDQGFEQHKTEYEILDAIRKSDFGLAAKALEGFAEPDSKKRAVWSYYIKANKSLFVLGGPPEYSGVSYPTQIVHLMNQGLYQFLHNGNEIEAYKKYKSALQQALSIDDKILACEAIRHVLELYDNHDAPLEDVSHNYFLNQHRKYAYDEFERMLCAFYNFRLELRFNEFETNTAQQYRKANKLAKRIGNTPHNLDLFTTNASYHYHWKKNIDSSFYYLDKVLEKRGMLVSYKDKRNLIAASINKSKYLAEQNRTKDALSLLNEVDIDQEGYLWDIARAYYYNAKRVIYRRLGQFDSVYYYLMLRSDFVQRGFWC